MDNNDLVFSDATPRSTIAGMARRGDLVQLARGVYTTDTSHAPGEVVRKRWLDIAGHIFPDATVTDRSAVRSGPVDGVLYLAHDRRDRDFDLPGLRLTARRGAPPQPSDIAMPGGLHFASRARGMLENAIPSRARSGTVPRRLTRDELGEWIEQTCRFDGEEKLNQLRDEARALAPALGVEPESFATVDNLIGVALGTRDAPNLPPALRARRYLRPYDPIRTQRFDLLVTALRSAPPQAITARASNVCLPFYEAYFSNFIEGTEFTLDEAVGIVYDDRIPAGRSEDAHDIVGTFRIVNDPDEMSHIPASPDDFVTLLRSRHAFVMAGRPDKHPGDFKEKANQARVTRFVDPDLVDGTLTEGYQRLADLDTAWERSVLAMFVVSEVHPFDDGNGRIARIMMNAELTAADQMRTIVPTVFRDDYLGALRRLSREDDPSVLTKALRYANDWTARIDFSDLAGARDQMAATNAFELAEEGGRLLMPSKEMFGEPIEVDISPVLERSDRKRTGAVRPYTRRDGTPVRGHSRNPRR
ncbi:Fic family protein [Acidiferrimicrobium sp. IK]|uniref:Fic family protein n=1 Tax=Acidiferrimicrobium sp. IK TaxID=2871700 RepID=UPI0021CB063F|nr:Fic family protein [Acidiferrimicrobium sp. IK]MCU4186322.1 Fic family protein [Acidiferrimicrobium sp. IK]